MKDDVRHLLAGYATGTLTDAEKKELFEAVLHDPELFAEIADEEPLRELLEPAAVRAELLERIEPASPGFREWLAGWLGRPGVLAGSAAAVVVVAAISVAPLVRLKKSPEAIALNDARPAEMVAPVTRSAPEREPPAGSPVQKPRVPSAASKAERSFQALLDESKLNARASNAPSGVVGGVVGGVIGGTPVEALPVPPPTAAPTPPPASLVAAKVAQHSSAPPLGYEVEQRGPTGEFAATANFSELKDHDVVRIRFRPSRSGFLAVHDTSTPDAAPVFSGQVAAASEVVTEAVTMDRDRRLEVVFVPSMPGMTSGVARADTESKTGDAMAVAPTRAAAQYVSSPTPDTTGRSMFFIELRRKP